MIYLSCSGFYKVEVRTPTEDMLEIEYNNWVFHELGGKRLFRRGEIKEIPEDELKRIKGLRPWKKYKWYNRPRK